MSQDIFDIHKHQKSLPKEVIKKLKEKKLISEDTCDNEIFIEVRKFCLHLSNQVLY